MGRQLVGVPISLTICLTLSSDIMALCQNKSGCLAWRKMFKLFITTVPQMKALHFEMYAYHLARLIIMQASFSVGESKSGHLDGCNLEQSGLSLCFLNGIKLLYTLHDYCPEGPNS